jgi:hypothetical protein
MDEFDIFLARAYGNVEPQGPIGSLEGRASPEQGLQHRPSLGRAGGEGEARRRRSRRPDDIHPFSADADYRGPPQWGDGAHKDGGLPQWGESQLRRKDRLNSQVSLSFSD